MIGFLCSIEIQSLIGKRVSGKVSLIAGFNNILKTFIPGSRPVGSPELYPLDRCVYIGFRKFNSYFLNVYQ